MQLSKANYFAAVLLHFLESTLNFEHFEKKKRAS